MVKLKSERFLQSHLQSFKKLDFRSGHTVRQIWRRCPQNSCVLVCFRDKQNTVFWCEDSTDFDKLQMILLVGISKPPWFYYASVDEVKDLLILE